MAAPHIVEFQPHWQQQARELIASCLSEFGYDLDPAGLDDDIETIAGHYAGPQARFWVLLAGDKVVGTVGVRRLNDQTCELKRMYLACHLRGCGHGRKLLQTAIDFAREAGYQRMLLNTVHGMQKAYWLYKSFGFAEIQPYRQNPRAAAFMAMQLREAPEPGP